MKKQTAVEWLVQEINKINVSTEARIFINKLEKQSKEMEKEQIIDAHGDEQSHLQDDGTWRTVTAEQYYKETFNTKEK